MAKKWQIVRVDWTDAVGGVRGGWKDVSSIEKGEPVYAVAFGVILRKDRHKVVVCPHFCGDTKGVDLSSPDTQGDGALTIPVRWIQKITVLGNF